MADQAIRRSNVVELPPRPPAIAPEDAPQPSASGPKPTRIQRVWLTRGLEQPGGKLPLFDAAGKRVSDRTVRACLKQGWAEPWFDNPIKPGWLICKLTDDGRRVIGP